MDWTEKYRPTTLSEVRGNDKARDAFATWGRSWDDHRKAVILHGSPGIGKTSAAHALANDMGWETVELNASDKRTGEVIERFAGRAAMNATLAGASNKTGDAATDRKQNRQLVILDEADNIHGNYDRGGASAITKLVKQSEQPIVLIANEFYDMSRGLRKACKDIEFRDVSARSIVPVLRDICRREGLEYDSDALERLAEANSGDLRGAVNDLQAAAEGNDRITLETIATGSRDQSMGIFEFLDAVLKEQDPQEALKSSYAVDETPDDITKWIEGNITEVYEGEELTRAYEFLANADRWLGRVRASQNYSYWRYAGDNAAAGVAAARDGRKGGWTRFSRPQFWPGSNKTADYVARKIAEESGVSMDTARRNVIPFLAVMTHHCKPKELTIAMAAAYDLEEKHVSFITGSGETTNKVQSIVEEAQELREAQMEEHSGSAFEGAVRSAEDEDTGAEETDDTDDGQATLAGTVGDDDTDDAEDEAEKDDGQSGLNDFF